MNNLKDIHNNRFVAASNLALFCQDVNEQFEGYTQPSTTCRTSSKSCFVRMSMNNLKDIHNHIHATHIYAHVVLSGCQ